MSTATGSLERRLSRTQLSLTERAASCVCLRGARSAADLQIVACMQKPAHAFAIDALYYYYECRPVQIADRAQRGSWWLVVRYRGYQSKRGEENMKKARWWAGSGRPAGKSR